MEVAGRYLHHHSILAHWQEMRQFCEALGGDLINLTNIVFYRDLMLYFRALSLTHFYFWIGATDEAKEERIPRHPGHSLLG
ncbi:hypothetical protein O3P69_015282 [Scylla paramamosain]|uniref:Uncharacterized protein n=1 Tax=Scylla paramamosain TaxID=85552 RepID=A0AAW0T3J3_SCYPA